MDQKEDELAELRSRLDHVEKFLESLGFIKSERRTPIQELEKAIESLATIHHAFYDVTVNRILYKIKQLEKEPLAETDGKRLKELKDEFHSITLEHLYNHLIKIP